MATALAPRRARSRGPSVQCARGAGAPAWKEGGGRSPHGPSGDSSAEAEGDCLVFLPKYTLSSGWGRHSWAQTVSRCSAGIWGGCSGLGGEAGTGVSSTVPGREAGPLR